MVGKPDYADTCKNNCSYLAEHAAHIEALEEALRYMLGPEWEKYYECEHGVLLAHECEGCEANVIRKAVRALAGEVAKCSGS